MSAFGMFDFFAGDWTCPDLYAEFKIVCKADPLLANFMRYQMAHVIFCKTFGIKPGTDEENALRRMYEGDWKVKFFHEMVRRCVEKYEEDTNNKPQPANNEIK